MRALSAPRHFTRFTPIFLVLLVVVAFAGCGDDDSTAPITEPNKVLQLDGDGDYLDIPFGDHTFTTFTIELKVKVPTYASNVHYVSLYQNVYLVLGNWEDGAISTWAGGLDPVAVFGDADPLTTDEWHHFAFSYDGANQYVLIDGVVVTTAATVGSVAHDLGHLTMGLKIGCRYSAGAQWVTGQIDEVRIWNIYRTPEQIAANRNKKLSARTGLVGYWNFDDGTAADRSGNDADGALMGDAAIVNE